MDDRLSRRLRVPLTDRTAAFGAELCLIRHLFLRLGLYLTRHRCSAIRAEVSFFYYCSAVGAKHLLTLFRLIIVFKHKGAVRSKERTTPDYY
jgi:hypothetical protein